MVRFLSSPNPWCLWESVPTDAAICPRVPTQIPGWGDARTPAGAPPAHARRCRRAGARAPPQRQGRGGGARVPRCRGPPPPRALSGEAAAERPERAWPRDGRYKSAPGGHCAPAAPPRWPRSLPAPGFSRPPTCGCGGRPPPAAPWQVRAAPPSAPRTCGSPPRAAAVLPAPGRRRGPPGRAPPQSCRLAAAGRGAACVSGGSAGPGPRAPWKPGRSGGAAGQSLGLRRSPRSCFRLLALPPALTVKGGPAGGAAAWGRVGVGSRCPGR